MSGDNTNASERCSETPHLELLEYVYDRVVKEHTREARRELHTVERFLGAHVVLREPRTLLEDLRASERAKAANRKKVVASIFLKKSL